MQVDREVEELAKRGGVYEAAVEAVVKVGEALGADRLIDVDTVHISGVSYLNIGDAGLEYLQDLASGGARFRVFTTVNPSGTVYGEGADEFSRRQKAILDALLRMGASLWLTCTPYEFLRIPPESIHAWGESNAIAYINSVYDAYTEKLPGPFTVLVAIVGKVPRFGLYVRENRAPKAIVRVDAELNQVKAGMLGRIIGESLRGEVPYVDYRGHWDTKLLKSFLASYATYSPNPLAIIGGVNPNWRSYLGMVDKADRIVVKDEDLKYVEPADYDALFIGCPHADLDEVREVVEVMRRLNFRRLKKPLIISTSRFVKSLISSEDLRRLEEANVIVITDTCPVVSPIMVKLGIRRVATPSHKAIFYMPRLVNVDALPCSLEECLVKNIED